MQIECFPDAPTEWPRKVFADVAAVNPTYKLDKSTSYPFIEMAAVAENFGGIISFDYRKADASGLARFKVGDILFGKITPCAENGKVALVKDLPSEFGLGSTEFIVLSPRNGNDRRFVYAMACANPVRGRAVSRMEGSTGRLRVTEDVFTKWLVVAAPPEPEQRAIADILDAVDAAIERTRTAIEKAQRLKRGLMQRVFSSGTRRAALKPTDLGHVPVNWDVIKGKEAFKTLGGATASQVWFARQGQEPDAWFMKVDDFNDPANQRRIVKTQRGFKMAENPKIETLPIGTVVIAKRGAAIEKNRVRVTAVPVTLDPNLMGLRLADGLGSEFFRYQLEWRRLSRFCENSGVPQLNNKDLYPRPFLRPPPDEQDELVEVLRAAEDQEDRVNDVLLNLEHLKRGLMQDLLTGRRRVPVNITADTKTMGTLQPS